MRVGQPGRLDDLVDVAVLQAGDVFADRAREQFDILRQVADMFPELFRGQWLSSKPSSVTRPEAGSLSPTRMRVKVLLPAAVSPMIATTSPGSAEKEMRLSTGLRVPECR